MNKIVREHYPVDKLPEDLRELVPNAQDVLIEITVSDAPKGKLSGAETAAMIRDLHRNRGGRGRTMDEIVKEVRTLRDEWED
jgi:hypothetical protein